MKGKKLVFAVILSLIVCLLLLPTCAYASDVGSDTYNSDSAVDPAPSDGDTPDVPDTPSESDPTAQPEGNKDDGQNPPSGDGAALDENKGDSDKDSTDNDEGGDTGDTDDTDADTDEGDSDADSDADDNDTHDDDSDDDADADASDDSDDGDDEDESDSADEPDKGNSENNSTSAPLEKTGFQVELTYNGNVVKLSGLQGGESHDFIGLLHELGIDGVVTEASGNADDLFNVTSAENGMYFNTLMAFGDPYQLVVTVDGVQYVIDVTDDGNVVKSSDYSSLQEAINKAADGSTILLEKDFTESITIAKEKTIIIDLNGHELTSNGTTVVNYGTLTMTGNGTVKSNSGTSVVFVNTGSATLNGGQYISETGQAFVLRNLGYMEINDGVIVKKEQGKANSYLIRNGWKNVPTGTPEYGVYPAENTAKLYINGGVFEDAAGDDSLIKNDDYGYLEINAGTFTMYGRELIFNVYVAQINGGTFTASGNGIIANNHSGAHNKSELEINGGIFNAVGNNSVLIGGKVKGNFLGGHSTIKAGTFNGNFPAEGNTYNITGGVYTDEAVKNLVGEYTVVTKCGDLYAVNESGYEFAKSGNTEVEIVSAFEGAELDSIPAGITVTNNSGCSVIINGITLNPGESYTVPAKSAESPVTAATTGEVLCAKYYVVDGEDQEWTKGSADGLKFELNADANGVIKVLIDGVEVEFTVENGEIVISAEVLEKLDAGEHEIEFVFADGSCKTDFVIK